MLKSDLQENGATPRILSTDKRTEKGLRSSPMPSRGTRTSVPETSGNVSVNLNYLERMAYKQNSQ